MPQACKSFTLVALALTLGSHGIAQGVRDHTRNSPRGTAVTESQANELTLTLTAVAMRPIQVWVRTAGSVQGSGQTLRASVSKSEAEFIKAGQRVRAFPPEQRSSMYQARVAQVIPRGDRAEVIVDLIAPGRQGSPRYVLEIVTEHGEYLSVPNEAIIETGDTRVVYVQGSSGTYERREIEPGLQGELFTEVVNGLRAGEQVVTFGSFFIDADYKLKGA
jgi:multidrug efflux pump subunit AcrA (membrane-fusion protein)